MGAFKPSEFHAGNRRFRMELAETNFESVLGIQLITFIPPRWALGLDSDDPLARPVRLGTVKLGFAPRTICIEAVQGEKGAIHPLKSLENATHSPWPNLLIKKIEAMGRRMGYREVRFRDVETMEYFRDINVIDKDVARFRRRHPEVKTRDPTAVWEATRKEMRACMPRWKRPRRPA